MKFARLSFASVSALGLILFLLLAGLASAQPPALMHYQGRLTTNAGAPITTAQTVYFSIYSGGTATVASQGTLLYQESKSITPDANGIFEHLIGSGTRTGGSSTTLDPDLFKTSQPIFLQVAVGTTGNVLLPRSQVTSVGYSFFAENANQATFAQTAGTLSGSTLVSGVTDLTGGLTVVGDLISVSGTGLSQASVLIGGLVAPIKSRTATAIVCQVPQGVALGLNPVSIISGGSQTLSATVAHVNIHRLLLLISPGANPQVNIFDANTRTLLAQINLGLQLGGPTTGVPNETGSLQMAFANQGSLAVIPLNVSGRNNQIAAIDLTAGNLASNGLVNNFSYNTTTSRVSAVAASPDGELLILSDTGGSTLRRVMLTQFFPPYSAAVFGNNYDFFRDPLNQPFKPSGFSLPRGSAFIGNNLFAVCSAGNNSLYAFRRDPATNAFFTYDPVGSTPPVIIQTQVSAGNYPFAIRTTNDRTQLLVTSNSGGLLRFFVAPQGFSGPAGTAAGGNNARQVAVSPDGRTVLCADSDLDLLHVYNIDPLNYTLLGDTEEPNGRTVKPNWQLAAIEPTLGDLVAIGTDDGTVQFFARDGGTLVFLNEVRIFGSLTNRHALELEFQP